MPPTVSVILIFLDAATYFDEALTSVREQTYRHWELILVDDGSTDGSTAIARRAAAADSRIRYLAHPGHENRGMSASRNLGIAQADGDLVAFLDADDVFLPEKLEHQVAMLEAHPDVGMVYGPRTYWYGWTGTEADRLRDHVSPVRVPVGEVLDPPTLLVRYLRDQARTPATCSVLVRREALRAVGGFEDSFTGMFEDQVLFTKLALHVRAVVTDRPLDRYRQHNASTTSVALRAGTWSRREQNPARDQFDAWLAAYASAGAPFADVIQREMRRMRRRVWWRRRRTVRMLRRATWMCRRTAARLRHPSRLMKGDPSAPRP